MDGKLPCHAQLWVRGVQEVQDEPPEQRAQYRGYCVCRRDRKRRRTIDLVCGVIQHHACQPRCSRVGSNEENNRAGALPRKPLLEIGRLLVLPCARLYFILHNVSWGSRWRIHGCPIIQRHRGSTIEAGLRIEEAQEIFDTGRIVCLMHKRAA